MISNSLKQNGIFSEVFYIYVINTLGSKVLGLMILNDDKMVEVHELAGP